MDVPVEGLMETLNQYMPRRLSVPQPEQDAPPEQHGTPTQERLRRAQSPPRGRSNDDMQAVSEMDTEALHAQIQEQYFDMKRIARLPAERLVFELKLLLEKRPWALNFLESHPQYGQAELLDQQITKIYTAMYHRLSASNGHEQSLKGLVTNWNGREQFYMRGHPFL